jgi:hypothetical protein
MHTIPRYRKKILLTYDKKSTPLIKMAYYDGKQPGFSVEDGNLKVEMQQENVEKISILFNDTEYGDIIDFKKKLILVEARSPEELAKKGEVDKIKADIQIWIMKSIRDATLPFLSK